MSRTKFLDAADSHSDWRQKNNLPHIHYEKLFAEVRDKWIQEKRYGELIAFIIEEWDSGNCDDFIEPLVNELIRTNESRLFKQLWKSIFKHRLDKLWMLYKHLVEIEPDQNWEKIASINLKGFGFTTKNFYDDRKKVVAFYRQFTLEGLSKYRAGLQQLSDNEELERVDKLIDTVTHLQKPSPKPSSDKRKIDEVLFWDLISDARKIAGNKYDFIDNLKTVLETFHPNEIRIFQKHLLTKLNELNSWDIWALAYIVRRGCGDDGFDYFKTWVVSKGEQAYNAVLSLDEKSLLDVFDEDPQLEELMYLAGEIYEDKTGDIMKPIKVKHQKIKGNEWTEENLQTVFPTLCKIFDFKTEIKTSR